VGEYIRYVESSVCRTHESVSHDPCMWSDQSILQVMQLVDSMGRVHLPVFVFLSPLCSLYMYFCITLSQCREEDSFLSFFPEVLYVTVHYSVISVGKRRVVCLSLSPVFSIHVILYNSVSVKERGELFVSLPCIPYTCNSV
jgi:hypothetical protein